MNNTSAQKARFFDDIVYQRMRHILMSYRNLRNGEAGNRYDWGELAGDISMYCIDQFPKNSLENFVRGWNEDQSGRNNKRKTKNNDKSPSSNVVHKFSIPKPERVEAIIEFLTDPQSKGYFCSKDILLASTSIQAPHFLQQYLNNEESLNDFFSLEEFKHDCHCCYGWDDAERLFDLSLKILSCLTNKAVIVEVVKTTTPEKKDYTIGNKLMKDAPEIFSGWAAQSKERNLFIFTKHIRTSNTVFYLSLGYGGRTSRHPFPDRLILLEHGLPESDFFHEEKNNPDVVLANIKENLLDSIYVLKLENV